MGKFDLVKKGAASKTNISSLFSIVDALDKPERKGYLTDILIEHLDHFSDHPFNLYPEDKLRELAESIKRNGVLCPIVVRQKQDGRFEILAGHNRTEAAKLAGRMDIPAKVIEVDDDDAIIIVTDTNLRQREKLLPSEKAFAYKMQLEAIQRKGDSVYPMDTQNAGEAAAQQVNESRVNVYRYIRLTHLIKELLNMVDEELIPFRAAVDLSYLTEDQQQHVHTLVKQGMKINLEKSSELKKLSQSGELNLDNDMLSGQGQKLDIRKPTYKVAIKKAQKQIALLPDIDQIDNPDELEQVIVDAVNGYISKKMSRMS